MKSTLYIAALLLISLGLVAQESDVTGSLYSNSAGKLLLKDSKLVVGGYGEVHYNQPLDKDQRSNGALDVHRMVLLFGYNFNERTSFVTELEFEHVKEVYVEQAFLQYSLNSYVDLRGGLLLVPMGIINEYHEPTTFHGVERPTVDKYIVPSTWREIGLGASGTILPASLRYQAYVMNGFKGYDGTANLSGKNGLRKGRQKGAESYISAPNFSARLEYYGIRGLNLGVSGYFGRTQSTLYDGVDRKDDLALAMADSSVVGVSMLGLDARYTLKGLQFRGQYYFSSLSGTEQYNAFTAVDGSPNDLGSAMTGYYAELAYDVLRFFGTEKQLYPFFRYEYLNTHQKVAAPGLSKPEYSKQILTAGLSLKLAPGAVVKADMQFLRTGAEAGFSKLFNAGVGVMF